MRKLNIVLIGYGYWGRNIARIILNHPLCKFLYIIDENKNRRESATQLIEERFVYENIHQLLIDNHNIDATIIATPVSTHYKLTKVCLLHKIPVLCEKVLSNDLEEIKELVHLSIEQKAYLDVDYTFLHNSVVQHIKASIDRDELGRLNYLTFKRTGLGPIREDVNVIYDLIPHDISILYYWLGMPQWVIANSRCVLTQSKADTVFVQIGYQKGLTIQLIASWASPLKQRMIEVVGEKKMFIFDDTSSSEKLKIYSTKSDYHSMATDFASFQLSLKSGDINIPQIDYPEPLNEMITHFLLNLHRKVEKDDSNYDFLINNSIIINAIITSSENKGKRIDIL
ncbi:MAG: Gfo/Idh/MocA family oxidoreductase [Chitinophagales bacterium]|nr:Gfo/Idh/MocA family oxidoreductase [Chitinophagales bacterium]